MRRAWYFFFFYFFLILLTTDYFTYRLRLPPPPPARLPTPHDKRLETRLNASNRYGYHHWHYHHQCPSPTPPLPSLPLPPPPTGHSAHKRGLLPCSLFYHQRATLPPQCPRKGLGPYDNSHHPSGVFFCFNNDNDGDGPLNRGPFLLHRRTQPPLIGGSSITTAMKRAQMTF
jgi:hypothetical protein